MPTCKGCIWQTHGWCCPGTCTTIRPTPRFLRIRCWSQCHFYLINLSQWAPSPFVSMMVVIAMVVFTLAPAVCSICFHLYTRYSKVDISLANNVENPFCRIKQQTFENVTFAVSFISSNTLRKCQDPETLNHFSSLDLCNVKTTQAIKCHQERLLL